MIKSQRTFSYFIALSVIICCAYSCKKGYRCESEFETTFSWKNLTIKEYYLNGVFSNDTISKYYPGYELSFSMSWNDYAFRYHNDNGYVPLLTDFERKLKSCVLGKDSVFNYTLFFYAANGPVKQDCAYSGSDTWFRCNAFDNAKSFKVISYTQNSYTVKAVDTPNEHIIVLEVI